MRDYGLISRAAATLLRDCKLTDRTRAELEVIRSRAAELATADRILCDFCRFQRPAPNVTALDPGRHICDKCRAEGNG